MRYRALGPLTAELNGAPVKLGGLRQQMVLAVLLSAVNRVVLQDSLIESVWAGDPPEAARATAQSYIYNLRQILGADAILRRGEGYVVEAGADNFDVLAFEERVDQARDVLESDPSAARESLVDGLRMWFGTAYGGVDHPELNTEIQRLSELRINAVEMRIEADLALGRDGSLVGELETLVREYPLRERFWAQLMLALYRSGRQAEALRAFQRARLRLVEELGIEPGAHLQRLEASILRHDPSLLGESSSQTRLPSHNMDLPDGVLAADQRQQAALGEPNSTGVMSPAGGTAIRGYELRQLLGEGNFGVVYRAYQTSVGREVAVKVIRPEYANNPDFVRRFEREAMVIANLEHPHIVPLYDYWRDPDGAYLVMPLMRGGNLADLLERGKWKLEPALRLLDQVGRALGHAHRSGVLHGDLKPGNVFLDEDGNAYLSDFGIAAGLTDQANSPLFSASGYVSTEEEVDDQPTVYSDIFRLGAMTFHLLTGVPPSATLSLPDLAEARPGLPKELAEAVARAMASDPVERYRRVEEYLRDVRRATGADVVTGSELTTPSSEPLRNPYKGLRAFSEDDATDFHGRSGLVDRLLEAVATNHLIVVAGPSGSGKSSAVRAGLIPALRAGAIPGSRDWLVTDMFPGSFPFEELEAALSRVAVDRPLGLMAALTEPNGLLRVAKRILPEDGSTLLIVIDQFEELFSMVRSEDVRSRFLENLVAVANDERSRIRVVATMRADFLDRPLDYADFAEAVGGGVVTVGPPTRDGLARAVAAPARAVGLELESGLVGRVTGDVLGQPGALPLLQYALTEMFARRKGSMLTIDGYEAAGGVTGALGRRAEELYEGLGHAGQEAARQVFLRLVAVDEFGSDTRRRARQSELVSLAVDHAGVESVLNAFARFRLITFDRDPVSRGPTVEVAHEALLSEWKRLRDWIDEARDSLLVSQRLAQAAREWVESGRDPSYLLRGSRLDEVRDWASDAGVVLAAHEGDYIEASLDRHQAELASARRRRRRTLVSLAAGLAVVTIFAVVAFVQRGVAEREAREARVRELAMASGSELGQNPEHALLVAAEAFDLSIGDGGKPVTEAVSALAGALGDWRLIGRFPAGDERIIAPSPDGSMIVTSTASWPSSDVNVYTSTGSLVGTLEGPDHPEIHAGSAVFHPDGEHVAVVYVSIEERAYQPAPPGLPDVVVFDAGSGSAVARLELDGGALGVSFSPSGRRVAVSSLPSVRVIEWEQGTEVARFDESSNMGRASFLDEETLLVPMESTGLFVYSTSSPAGSPVSQIPAEGLNLITSLDSTRTRLAYVAGDRVRVVDLVTGDVLFDRQAPGTIALALSPDGTRVTYSGFDPTIHVVPVEGEGEQLELLGSLGNVGALQYVDADRLLSHGSDALMWNVSNQAVDELGGIPLALPQWGYQMSPDGSMMSYFVSIDAGVHAAGDPRDGFRVVDTVSQEQILVREGEVATVIAGIRLVSPDFTMVGSLTHDGASSVRRVPSWELVREFDGCRNPLAFSPDNSLVLLTGWAWCGGEARVEAPATEVMDLESGAPVLTLSLHSVFSAEFNPAGVFRGGRYLVATDQERVEAWDLDTGETLGRLEGSALGGGILTLAFDPTGRYVVGGTSEGVVWVVDMEQVVEGTRMVDALVFNRQAHSGAAPVPALSADGIVGTAGYDGMVRLWDLASGELKFEFEANMTTPVVRFTPDGSHLLYPHGLSIRRMPVDPVEVRQLASELLTRDFLPEECARYDTIERCELGEAGGA